MIDRTLALGACNIGKSPSNPQPQRPLTPRAPKLTHTHAWTRPTHTWTGPFNAAPTHESSPAGSVKLLRDHLVQQSGVGGHGSGTPHRRQKRRPPPTGPLPAKGPGKRTPEKSAGVAPAKPMPWKRAAEPGGVRAGASRSARKPPQAAVAFDKWARRRKPSGIAKLRRHR